MIATMGSTQYGDVNFPLSLYNQVKNKSIWIYYRWYSRYI